MNALVADSGYTRRVGPKVFTDLPTETELRAAKGRSAWLLIFTVFLAGCFVASLLALGYVLRQDYPQQLRESQEEVTRVTAELENTRAAISRDYGAFTGLSEDRRAVADLREGIRAMLAGEDRTAGDKRGAENDPRVRRQLAMYLSGGAWTEQERRSREALQAEALELQRGQQAVRNWVRPVGPGASPFGPNSGSSTYTPPQDRN